VLVMLFSIFPVNIFAAGGDGNPPEITVQPEDCTVDAGENASFSVTASCDKESLSYQWENSDDGTEWNEATGVADAVYDAENGTSAITLTVNAVPVELNGMRYRCVVTDKNGSVTSEAAILTVNSIQQGNPPVITGQPEDCTVYLGAKASFNVEAAGGDEETLAYRWESSIDGNSWSTIDGAEMATYSITATTASMNGLRYRCVVTDKNGSVTSDAAILTVLAFGGGSGTEEDPYLISSKADLEQLAADVNGGLGHSGMYFKQTCDIDLNGSPENPWIPIGETASATRSFQGCYDGGGHNITGLYINDTATTSSAKARGLFGNVRTAVIKNVNIISPDITVSGGLQSGTGGTGALAGVVRDSAISGCTVRGGSVTSDYWTGGLVGMVYLSTAGAEASIANSYTNCHTVAVQRSPGAGYGTGGIVGNLQIQNNHPGGTIAVKNCYAVGDVDALLSSAAVAGGIAGAPTRAASSSSTVITIENCYAVGKITLDTTNANGRAGGIIGKPNTSTATSSNIRIKNNAALNSEISNLKENTNDIYGRILGEAGDSGLTGNIAWNNMKVNGATVTGGTAINKNGADIALTQLKIKSTWEDLGFDFTGGTGAWEWDEALSFPKLRGLSGQNASPFPTEGNPPVISGQPQSLTVAAGQSASFSVTATGDAASLAYQWESSADGNSWAAVENAEEATYTIAAVTADMDGYRFRCVVTDKNGSIVSDAAILTVIGQVDASPQAQLMRVKAFYDATKALSAPLEATALYGAGVDIGGYNTDALTESAYYLRENSSSSNETFEVTAGGMNVHGQLAMLIMDGIALGKDPADLNGRNYVYELNKYQGGRLTGSLPRPTFGNFFKNVMSVLGLHAYWGTDEYPMQDEYPACIGEAICVSDIMENWNSSSDGGFVAPAGFWELNDTISRKIAGTFWVVQLGYLCAEPSQLSADNIEKSIAFLNSEYAKTGGENRITASCELMAAYIMTRLSAGEEVSDEMWSNLAAFQTEDGSYKRKLADTVSNREATVMALMALSQNENAEKKSVFSRLSFSDSAAKAKAKADIEAVEKDAYALAPDVNNLKPLPLVGANSTKIAWTSSNAQVIANDGTVNCPQDGSDITVTLTAVTSRGTSSLKRTFPLRVEPLDPSYPIEERHEYYKEFYQTKQTLDTAWEPVSVLSGMGSLEGFDFNLPYYGSYYSYTGTYDRRASEALAALDTMARGGNPRDYTRNISGTSSTEQVDLIQIILDKQQTNGSFSIYDEYGANVSNIYYTLALEAYFNGQPWGNEREGTNLGRAGAIKYILGKMMDFPLTGGRIYAYIYPLTQSTGIDDWFRYQSDLAILLARLKDDDTPYDLNMTIGQKAQAEMDGLLKSLRFLFHEKFSMDQEYEHYKQEYVFDNPNGICLINYYLKNAGGGWELFSTSTTIRHFIRYTSAVSRYISALVAAGRADEAVEDGAVDRLRVAADLGGVEVSNAARMMALGDLANNKAILTAIAFDTGTVSDEEAVSADMAALSVPEVATVNLVLPVSGPNGSTIIWTSGNPQIISSDGIVNRPGTGSPDIVVTLIATVSRESVVRQRVFSVTVPAIKPLSDQELAQTDLDAISLPRSTIKDISLPSSGGNGSIITWSSDLPQVISNDGAVCRPQAGSDDAVVNLTATAVLNGETAYRNFTIIVPAMSSDIVKEAVNTIKEQYNTDTALTGGYWEVFAARSVLEDDFDDYDFTFYDVRNHRKDSAWQPTDYAAVILQLLATGENPYNYKGNNYVQGLINYYETNKNWGPYACPGWAGMALEAAGADISDEARNAYIGYCKAQLKDLSYGPDMAGWDLIVLANHLDANGVKDAIGELRSTLKASQVQSGENIALFNTGGVEGGSITMSNACVVSGFQALAAAGMEGFDLTADEWKVNGVGVMDTLYNLEIKGKESFNTQIAVAFGDAYHGDSVWRRIAITAGMFDEQIEKAEIALADAGNKYTVESLQNLQNALEAAKTARGDSARMSRRAFGAEYFALKDATDGLIERGTATLAIIGDVTAGTILPSTGLRNITGRSIAYILSEVLKEKGLSFSLDASGAISGLAGLSAGSGSAWYCYVNGSRIAESLTTATINEGDELVLKFCADIAIVSAGATLDEHVVTEAAAALSIEGDLNAVAGDLSLPGQGAFGTAIVWESSNDSIVSNDGTVKRPSTNDVKVKLTAKITFGNAMRKKSFDVTVKALNPSLPGELGSITVTFKLIGDKKHGSADKHTAFQTWVPKTTVTVPEGSTVYDVFDKVLAEKNVDYDETAYNYIGGIKAPASFGGHWLYEFDNGPYSGWMYTVNGKHPNVGLRSYTLKNGDDIVWHYTDDYRYEEGSEKWKDENFPSIPVIPATSGDSVEIEAVLDENGKAALTISGDTLSDLLKKAVKAAGNSGAVIVLTVKVPDEAETLDVVLSREAAGTLAEAKGTALKISSKFVELTFDAAAAAAVANASKTADTELSITVAAVPVDSLPAEARAAVGNRPVFDFGINMGDTVVSSFGGGSVRIGIPYTPAANEDKNAIIVYYLNGKGGLEIVKNGRYDPDTGLVYFSANHFSRYAVGYNKKSFTDTTGKWMEQAVEYLAARNIIYGVDEKQFAPDGKTTRAEFVTLLMRALEPDVNASKTERFIDVADEKYYSGAVLEARTLGLVDGVGGNRFNPDEAISREQMFTITYRALEKLGLLGGYGKTDNKPNFTDKAAIASYAVEAVDALAGYGLVNGSDGRLNPKGIASRAECAQFLFNVLTGMK
jgi:hypothetical protein